jgi:hypothetical protein
MTASSQLSVMLVVAAALFVECRTNERDADQSID